MQQGVQTDAKCNIQHCWELLANNVASVCTGLDNSDASKSVTENIISRPVNRFRDFSNSFSLLKLGN